MASLTRSTRPRPCRRRQSRELEAIVIVQLAYTASYTYFPDTRANISQRMHLNTSDCVENAQHRMLCAVCCISRRRLHLPSPPPVPLLLLLGSINTLSQSRVLLYRRTIENRTKHVLVKMNKYRRPYLLCSRVIVTATLQDVLQYSYSQLKFQVQLQLHLQSHVQLHINSKVYLGAWFQFTGCSFSSNIVYRGSVLIQPLFTGVLF